MCLETLAETPVETEQNDAGSPLEALLAGVGRLTFTEQDTEVSVGWMCVGGDGLLVTARVDEAIVGQTRFWCDAEQWVDWLAPSVPVPTWEDLPLLWRKSAASLTLETRCLDEGMSERGVDDVRDASVPATSWPKAESIACERMGRAWGIGIVLRRNARQLALMYRDGATSWLQERCRHARPDDVPLDPSGLPERRCLIVAGWAVLPASLCDRLRGGGAVLLDVGADVSAGEYWLIDGDRAIAMRDGQPVERRVVALDALNDGSRDGGNRDEATPQCTRVFAVIAERPIPIPCLMAWRVGRPASIAATTQSALCAGRIALWRDGAPWVHGGLLRFGDGRLAVQIDFGEIGSSPIIDAHEAISGGDPMGVHSATT